MDLFSKLSREAQAVLVGGVVLLILSFFPWQEVSFSFGSVGVSASLNEWHGIGFLAALLVIAMLAWEVVRLMGVDVSLGSLSPGLVSVGLVVLTVLFTVIAFFDKSDARNWPAWIALIVALVVGAAGVMRARAEGVQMPHAGSAGSTGAVAPSPPAEPAAPTEATELPSE